VMVSDFVTPHFFDPAAGKGEQFDYLNVVNAPFTLARGGYAVVWAEGSKQPTQIFGRSYPAWRRETKKADTARSARRMPG
jgi:hypothetical protein